jgi:hypothetical protein
VTSQVGPSRRHLPKSRSEKREVTGSTPVPTTGKRPDQGLHHLERGVRAVTTALP